MPNEARRLVFNKTEVAQALIAFNRHAPTKFLAEGYLSAIALHGGPNLNIEISVETPDGFRQEVTVGSAIVAAAMIRFCMERKVPLPMKADKMLEVINDRLVLEIRLPPQAVAPIVGAA